jgi:DNA-binding response OmpR family regulator
LTEKPTILAVDDDPRALEIIREMLGPEGYNVITAGDGQTALKIFAESQPDLVLLDIRMPGMDGFAVFRQIRKVSQTPVIFITGFNTSEKEVAMGLNIGADDYITKPFSYDVLVARVKAVLRRGVLIESHDIHPFFQCHNIRIDVDCKTVTLKDDNIDLTATEYRLLTFLAERANRIVSASEILRAVWGEDYIQDTHLLQVTIGRLRRKLNDVKGLKYIRNKKGKGYILNTD